MRTIRRKEIIRPCNYDWPTEIKGDGPFYAINPYVGCQHNCSYCWAKDMTNRFRKPWGLPDDFEWDKPLVVENALELLEKELKTKKPGRVLLSSMTDPYQPLEARLELTKAILERLLEAGAWKVVVLTKAAMTAYRDRELFSWFNEPGEEDRILIGATITDNSLSADMGGNFLARLYEGWAIATFVSLEPWMPDTFAEAIIARWEEIVDYWIIGSLNKAGQAVDRWFYQAKLAPLMAWMDAKDINYYIKKELRQAAGEEE